MAVRTKMEPHLTLLKEKRNVHVLTPDEWDALGSHHQTYFTYHAGMGHCHAVDLGIQAHQAEFKKKYGAEKIDYLMEHGSYAVITQASKGIHAVGSKLRNAASEEAVIEPFLLSCGQFWASVDILLAITIFLIGTGPEAAPLVLLFTLIAILDDLIAIFTCP